MKSSSKTQAWCQWFGVFFASAACAAVLALLFGASAALASPFVPVREDAEAKLRNGAHLRLGLKHYPENGGVPVLLLHGFAQNDRGWDNPQAQYSFARYLHERGFDVWIGNLRNAGTPGFRSELPPGPHHFTVENYAIEDVPALIAKVTESTGKKPFVVAHSMGAWAMEGYLAGLTFDQKGRPRPGAALGQLREAGIQGLVTIAGVYSLWWPKAVDRALEDPIRTEFDFYQSNYELELLARSWVLREIVPELPELPLGWMGKILDLPLDRIPLVGAKLRRLWGGVQNDLIETPLFSLFYHSSNSDPQMVRDHVKDGMEELGPKLLEQLALSVERRATLSHQDLSDCRDGLPAGTFAYADVRKSLKLPLLFVAGSHDRLANAQMIYEDGYLRSASPDKTYLLAPEAGHLDVLTGRRVQADVFAPVTAWIQARAR